MISQLYFVKFQYLNDQKILKSSINYHPSEWYRTNHDPNGKQSEISGETYTAVFHTSKIDSNKWREANVW